MRELSNADNARVTVDGLSMLMLLPTVLEVPFVHHGLECTDAPRIRAVYSSRVYGVPPI